MSKKPIFSGRHFSKLIILQCVRWYLRYPLSYRQISEMMRERGVEVDHSTIYRWVQKYVPEFDRRIRWHTKTSNVSWKVDETYIKIKGKWKYLYRAVNSQSQTIDFMLSHTRDTKAAIKFLTKALSQSLDKPARINTDKLPSYACAINEMREKKLLPEETKHTMGWYMNNRIEQDHRRIKRRVKPMLGFKSYNSANRVIKGIEAMNMVMKRQICGVSRSVISQNNFINKIFGVYIYQDEKIAI